MFCNTFMKKLGFASFCLNKDRKAATFHMYMYLNNFMCVYRKLRCAWRLAANIWDYTRIGNSGEVTSCSHELRLYWHRLCGSWWRLAVTSWGSGPGDVFQSLAEAQIQAISCSHYLRLCLHRVLRLGWRLAVTIWDYALYKLLRLGWRLSSH